jgi:cysteine sulfinate desulfinase/cysteine desulfurase-like protein
MYSDLTLDNEIKYLNYPYLVEAGTKNIAGIIGISKAIEFCVKYQIPQSTHSQELRKYFIDQ